MHRMATYNCDAILSKNKEKNEGDEKEGDGEVGGQGKCHLLLQHGIRFRTREKRRVNAQKWSTNYQIS